MLWRTCGNSTVYGDLNRVCSSRRFEVECLRNIEVIWRLRRLAPDFKTIADLGRNSRKAFKQLFREFVLSCRQLDLIGRELIAVDGTRIKAVNGKDRSFNRVRRARLITRSDERLENCMARLDTGDKDEDGTPSGGKTDVLAARIAHIRVKNKRRRAPLARLDDNGEDQLSLTDADARAMARMTKVGVGYDVQIAVDAGHCLIAEQPVTNRVLYYAHLTATAEAAGTLPGADAL